MMSDPLDAPSVGGILIEHFPGVARSRKRWCFLRGKCAVSGSFPRFLERWDSGQKGEAPERLDLACARLKEEDKAGQFRLLGPRLPRGELHLSAPDPQSFKMWTTALSVVLASPACTGLNVQDAVVLRGGQCSPAGSPRTTAAAAAAVQAAARGEDMLTFDSTPGPAAVQREDPRDVLSESAGSDPGGAAPQRPGLFGGLQVKIEQPKRQSASVGPTDGIELTLPPPPAPQRSGNAGCALLDPPSAGSPNLAPRSPGHLDLLSAQSPGDRWGYPDSHTPRGPGATGMQFAFEADAAAASAGGASSGADRGSAAGSHTKGRKGRRRRSDMPSGATSPGEPSEASLPGGSPAAEEGPRHTFTALFHRLADGDGITCSSLGAAIGAAKAEQIVSMADSDGDGRVSLAEWFEFISQGLKARGETVDTATPDAVAHFAAMFGGGPQPGRKKKGKRKGKGASRAGSVAGDEALADPEPG